MEKDTRNIDRTLGWKEKKYSLVEELKRRKEVGELNVQDFTAEDIWHFQNDEGDRPVKRKDLEVGEKSRALVVSIREFYDLGYWDILILC